MSSAANLVTNSLTGNPRVYVRDLQAGLTTLVDADTNGVGSGTGLATPPQMTPDARFVAFECADAGLAPNDRNHDYDLFVRDLAAGTNELISVRNPALPTLTPNGSSMLSACSVSTNGRYVAFTCEADNLLAGDTNGYADIYVCDLQLGTNLPVSLGTNGLPADGPSSDAAIAEMAATWRLPAARTISSRGTRIMPLTFSSAICRRQQQPLSAATPRVPGPEMPPPIRLS